ncbi:hypothetical protein [Kineococcus terrestris]|uniref:hypothetical protein n=1 Tax=Kineococcus terrestris TaxID=2044856 RepID=UPI0034DB7B95
MAVSVWVENYLGERIEYWGGWEINDLLRAAHRQPDTFVLLCGVDPYDITVFNSFQCRRLDWELQEIGRHTEDETLRATAARIRQLCDLLRRDLPSGPMGHHVRFIGD